MANKSEHYEHGKEVIYFLLISSTMHKGKVNYDYMPAKPLWSYILLFFPILFCFRFVRRLFSLISMKHCKHVEFEPGFRFYYGHNIYAQNVALGNTLIMDYGDVHIGEGTTLSKNNILITATHDCEDRKKIIIKPISIGKNVWISTGCIVLPGVTIGDNSVIGAGSVVSKDIPAHCVVVGNPASVVRKLSSR